MNPKKILNSKKNTTKNPLEVLLTQKTSGFVSVDKKAFEKRQNMIKIHVFFTGNDRALIAYALIVSLRLLGHLLSEGPPLSLPPTLVVLCDRLLNCVQWTIQR